MRNNFTDDKAKRAAKWKLWLKLSDGRTLHRYSHSLPDQRDERKGLDKLINLATKTEWPWVAAVIYDNQRNTQVQHFKPEDLGRIPPN
jgi:hypothetical protein